MALINHISAAGTLENYPDRIQNLSRAQQFFVQDQSPIEKALEELKEIHPRLD